MKLVDIEGVGPAFAKQLAKAGIRSLEMLLKKGATPAGRKEIAMMSGIGDKLILEWVNLADLFRIKGVASEMSELLEVAGVMLSVMAVAHLASDGRTNWFEGFQLLAIYAILAVAFYYI